MLCQPETFIAKLFGLLRELHGAGDCTAGRLTCSQPDKIEHGDSQSITHALFDERTLGNDAVFLSIVQTHREASATRGSLPGAASLAPLAA